MSILVIAATEIEIGPFIANNQGVKSLITGVGCPSAIYQLTQALLKEKYSLVIQVGIAGSFNRNQSLGESVIIEKDCFADVGVNEKNIFKNVFDLGFSDANEYPFNDGYLINSQVSQLGFGYSKVVDGMTVNYISDNEEYLHQLQIKYKADIESMEGAALHYVCLKEQMPFVQIRGISNYVGERDKSNWKIKEAVESSNRLLFDIIRAFQKNELL